MTTDYNMFFSHWGSVAVNWRWPQYESSQRWFSWLAKKSSVFCRSRMLEFCLQLKPDHRLASLCPLFDLMGLFRSRCGMWGNHLVLFYSLLWKSRLNVIKFQLGNFPHRVLANLYQLKGHPSVCGWQTKQNKKRMLASVDLNCWEEWVDFTSKTDFFLKKQKNKKKKL